MGQKELLGGKVLEMVKDGRMTLVAASEKLKEHEGLAISRESLTQLLIVEGLWKKKRMSF